jgi:hypothetical protein
VNGICPGSESMPTLFLCSCPGTSIKSSLHLCRNDARFYRGELQDLVPSVNISGLGLNSDRAVTGKIR